MGDVIQGVFPQYRKPQEIVLEQMAAEVFNQLHAPDGPQLGGVIEALKYFDGMPPEAS